MLCMTQMTIHIHKVNQYMKYQSAVEILSMLASRVLLPENAFKHCIRQQYTTKTSTVTPHFYCNFRPYMTCWIFVPSFITNLWQILFPANHLKWWRNTQTPTPHNRQIFSRALVASVHVPMWLSQKTTDWKLNKFLVSHQWRKITVTVI